MNVSEVQPIYDSNRVQVLKAQRLSATEVLVLYRSSELRYFKNGRANMHVRVTYSVEVLVGAAALEGTRGVSYGLTNKSKAIKLFNETK